MYKQSRNKIGKKTKKIKFIKKHKRREDTKGAPVTTTGPSLLIVIYFFLLNPRYSSLIWVSTLHKILHGKHLQNH
jgi:hypothetical protein